MLADRRTVVVDDDDDVPTHQKQSVTLTRKKRRTIFDYVDTESSEEWKLIVGNGTEDKLESHRIVRDIAGGLHETTTRQEWTVNHEFFVEVMVVADKKMLDYHKTKEELLVYIKALMHHVR